MHRFHPVTDEEMRERVGIERLDDPEALLYDECGRCDQHAADPRGLDEQNLARAWHRMLEVNWGSPLSSYRSHNEAKLCNEMYRLLVLTERLMFMGVDLAERG